MSAKNAGLSNDFIEQQRKRLVALRQELKASSAVAAQRDRQDVSSDGVLDTADMGEIATERRTDEALDKVNERRLRTVERALQKIAEGTYGLSDLSGKAIPQERLQTLPEAIYTVDEKSARESDAA